MATYSSVRKQKKAKSPKLLIFITIILMIAVIFSLFATRYWFFDLFANFSMQYSVISLATFTLLLLYKKKFWAFINLSVFAISFYNIYPVLNLNKANSLPEEARYDSVSVLQYNVHRNNDNIDDIAKWIISKSQEVDIVVLFEVTEKWETALMRLRWAYPYHINKEVRGNRSIAILSRLYIDDLEVKNLGENETPVIVMRGETTGYEIPFTLYGIHPPPPVLPSYASQRNDILISSAKTIANEPNSHKILIGDFNATRYSPWFKKMVRESGLKDSNEGIGITNSWPKYAPEFLRIPIDNMLISESIIVDKKEKGPSMGSDHIPIITSLKFLKD